MIRDTGIYKVKILKEDVKNWNDDEYVYFVKTDNIESAIETQSIIEEKDQLQQSHDTYVKEVWNQHMEIQNLKAQLEDYQKCVDENAKYIQRNLALQKQLEQKDRILDEIKGMNVLHKNGYDIGIELKSILQKGEKG